MKNYFFSSLVLAGIPRNFGHVSDSNQLCAQFPFIPEHDQPWYGQCHCTDCKAPEKSEGTIRVLVLGDSVLSGDHIYGYDGRNMPFYLAQKLNDIEPG